MDLLKLASVSFVNAAPLNYGFLHGPHRTIAATALVPPARIGGLLASGEADAGLIPSIDFQTLDAVTLLPGVCIASRRRARSVFLASRVPIEKVRRVALDAHSHTSAALLRILFAHRGLHGVVWGERAPSLRAMLRDHDAALLIGDAALTAETTGLEVLDLAADWRAITGLPFVFALWAVRDGVALRDGAEPFLESYRLGAARIAEIAGEAAARLGLEVAAIEDYLTTNIDYRLGPEEIRGLDLFYRQAFELGVAPRHRPIRFLATTGPEPAAAMGGR